MTQAVNAPSVGDLDAPVITLLGSLDDEQGNDGLELGSGSPNSIHAVIYTGI